MQHRALIPVLALAVLLCAPPAMAADPQPYAVKLDATDDARLNGLLHDASQLLALQQNPIGPFALLGRVREDRERFRTALRSLGYYQGEVRFDIDGRDLDDPELYPWLAAAPAEPPPTVHAAFVTGPQFRLGSIGIGGDAPADAAELTGLKSGDPAVAADVLAAGDKLQKALQDKGHALAEVAEPVATLHPDSQRLDVMFQVAAGPRLNIGSIELHGLKHVSPGYVRNRLNLVSGRQFSDSAIEQARRDLAALGLFSTVRVEVGKQADADGRVPIELDFRERPRHAVNAGAAYSTDIGGSLSTSWLNRNLLGAAEQLSLDAAVTQIGGNSTTGVGYKTGLGFSKPDFLLRDQTLQLGVDVLQQSLIAYDIQAETAFASLKRKLDKFWQSSLGVSAQQERVGQEGVTRDYTLLGLPLTGKYDSSNSPLDPSEGRIFSATLTPTTSFSAQTSKLFVLVQASASAYFDLSGSDSRSVLAMRGQIADSGGANQFELPPDKRFYAGGSASVRGYKYQSIGPTFADGKPQGGTAMAAASLELRQRFLDDYGVVLFADAGQVGVNALPFANRWLIGAGVGGRYYTSFGPIRIDVALPVTPQPGSGSFELYVGLGQAF